MTGQNITNKLARGNKEKVARLISSVLEKVSKAEEVSRDAIYHELIDLQHVIEESRREIGMIGPSDINGKDIPDATDELDAVVAATANATGVIMDCCDMISDRAMVVGGESGDVLMEQVTKIYEACSFQDITGQRITKVVKTLKSIEQKIDHLVQILGDKIPGMPVAPMKDRVVSGDESLLNGPQLPANAITQDEIDRLLEDFED